MQSVGCDRRPAIHRWPHQWLSVGATKKKNDFGQKTEICKGNSAERVAAVSGSSDNRRAPSLARIQVQLMDTIDGAGDSFPPNPIVQWRPPWAEAFSYFGGSSASQGGCCCWSIISDSEDKVCEGRWLASQTGQ